MGGQQLSNARFLAFSRSQESLADQTAIRLLKDNGFSSSRTHKYIQRNSEE